jgi:hypothetical protein
VPVRLSAAAALAIALSLPASAAGAVKTGFDRHAGMRLTLDGRVLTAKIANSRGGDLDLEEHLYGKRIDAVCGSSFLYPRGAKVVRRQRWPVGTRRMSFRFGRDISRNARWCLIEHHAADVAAVSFIEREPIRFVGKGRGPSGAWWRLGGGTGELAEPCALLRTESAKAPWCFSELAARRVTLAVQQWPPGCAEDGYVIGVVTLAAATVRLVMADGTTADARLFDPPQGSRLRARFFVAALAGATIARSVQALDSAGTVLATRRASDDSEQPCP